MIRLTLSLLAILFALEAHAQRPAPLSSPREIQRFAMVMAMADNQRFDTTALDLALATNSLALRREAALAMGQIGRSPNGWPANSVPQRTRLWRLLGDNYDYIVAASAYSLGLLRDSASADTLAKIVHIGGAVGREASWALGRIGNPAARHISDLLKKQHDEGTTIQLLLAAARLRPVPLADIRPYLQHDNPSVIWAAAYAISRNRLPGGARDMIALHDSANRWRVMRKVWANKPPSKIARGPYVDELSAVDQIAGEIARALLKQVTGDSLQEPAFKALRSLVHDHHPHVRINAVRSLATYGSVARPQILLVLRDGDANVRVAASEVLENVIDTTFADWGQIWNWDVSLAYRANILTALAKHNGPAAMLSDWVTHKDWRKRMLAAEAVGSMRDKTRRAEHVRTLISDPDARVRGRMYSSLTPADGTPDSTSARLLRTALESDPDSIVKQLARTALRIPNPDSLHAIRIIPRPLAWYERVVREVVAPTLDRRPRIVTLHTERGDIKLEMFGADAPITVWNFINLAKTGWYEGTAFHRVVPNFVIQDGNRRGDGEGGPGYSIRDEMNPNRYERGALGMALAGPHTGGAEYFITHSPQPHLDGGYTVFGKIVSGFNALDRIVRGDAIADITITSGTRRR